MNPDAFLTSVIDPGLELLGQCGGVPISDQARVMLLAIALQETGLSVRRQQPNNGPARGFWQFESGGGVAGVLRHTASSDRARRLCEALLVPPDQAACYEAIAWNDDLATGFARLLLWTDPTTLPAIGNEIGAWNVYVNLWRPGKPRLDAWPANYRTAANAVRPA